MEKDQIKLPLQGSTSTIYIDRNTLRLKRNWDKYFKNNENIKRNNTGMV
jgi:hypothetical protein